MNTYTTMWNSVVKLWKAYKYRFVPWIIFNVKTDKPIRTNPGGSLDVQIVSIKEDCIMTDAKLTQQLSLLLTEFKRFENEPKKRFTNEADIYFNNLKIMTDIFGFAVRTGTSRIAPNAGLGVFVTSGTVKAGSIVGLYPGTVYKAFEPIFFPSINNSYIFRCSDGIHIDGKMKGISKSIFKSCAARDRFHFHLPCCDKTWLTPYPLNPLNTGQLVNNKSGVGSNNVVYQECFLPLPSENNPGLEIPLWKYIPNVWCTPGADTSRGIKVIPLVATKDIREGEELLSSYFTVVKT